MPLKATSKKKSLLINCVRSLMPETLLYDNSLTSFWPETSYQEKCTVSDTVTRFTVGLDSDYKVAV